MTTKRYATRDFTDAGTGRKFKLGQELTGLKAGELGNYEHAGLASDEPPKAVAAADPKAGKA